MKWLHHETGLEVSELGGFEVIYADPCWQYGDRFIRGAAENHYTTMSLAEMCMLPVEDLAAPDAALFMWATWPTLLDAFALMKAWGFEYKNCAFCWAKTNRLQPTPFVGLGHWTRGNTEPCLLGIRGKPKRMDAAVQQLLVEDELLVAPVGRHSAKPKEAHGRISRLMGDVSSIELFARERVSGWECWGNETESSVSLVHDVQMRRGA